MPNIVYYFSPLGHEMGRWPGNSVKTPKGPRKQNQIALGKVIDKEKLIFYKRSQGYYRFDPSDQSIHELKPDEIPAGNKELDMRCKKPPVIVLFGGSYFLHQLIAGIQYDVVIDKISYVNRDRLYSMFQYYVLCNRANNRAKTWYDNNYTKFLYPKANLASQRISDFLAAIGTPENVRSFLDAHIPYVLEATNHEKSVLIDSTGCPNKCSLYVTKISVHENEKHLEFRVIVVVQKSTGIPLYYRIIPGNVVDISTAMSTIRLLNNMGCEVEYVLGDAGYCCPAVMERMIWAGVDFMTRLSPNFTMFKDAVKENYPELEKIENLVDYHGRKVYVRKSEAIVAHDKETGNPVKGYVYLCKDIQAYHSKVDHLMKSKKFVNMDNEQFLAACTKLGLFAIVTTKDFSIEEVLPEYYIRQGIEQFFDHAKNYGKYLPVRCRTMETLAGHMLLAFMATFVVCLVEYRLNRLNTRYVCVQDCLVSELPEDEAENLESIEVDDKKQETLMEQDILLDIFKDSAGELFETLQYQKADVFEKEIIPEPPMADANSLYAAYKLHSPFYIERTGESLNPVLREKETNACSKAIAFARTPTLSDEEIRVKREKKALEKLKKEAAKQGVHLEGEEQDASEQTEPDKNDTQPEKKRGPGRPKGSKNKKTLEREAELKRLEEQGLLPPKRGPGRPKSQKTLEREAELKRMEEQGIVPPKRGPGRPKSQKTLEREAELKRMEEEGIIPEKRGPGRPKGSKNKKTLEKEAKEKSGSGK